jgi:hypothetical protein
MPLGFFLRGRSFQIQTEIKESRVCLLGQHLCAG